MNAKGKRLKGKTLELEIAKDLRDFGLVKNARRMPLSGAIEGFKSDIFCGSLPLSIEAKRQETTKFRQWYEQAENSANQGKLPVVVWRQNHDRAFAFLSWESLLEILQYAVDGGLIEKPKYSK